MSSEMSPWRVVAALVSWLVAGGTVAAMTVRPSCLQLVRPGASLAVEQGDTRRVENWHIVSVNEAATSCAAVLTSGVRTAALSVSSSGIRLTPLHARRGEGWVCGVTYKGQTMQKLACWPTDGVE